MSSSNCRMICDLVVLGLYALLLVAFFQIEFSQAVRRRSNINTNGASFLLKNMRTSHDELAFMQSTGEDAVQMCQESQCTPFQQLDRTEQYRELKYLFTDKNTLATMTTAMTTRNDFAICKFQNMDAYNFHFPHTMQQLYRCWSWWRLRQEQNGEKPVLVFPRSTMPENEFLQGFAVSLQTAVGLEMWTPNKLLRNHFDAPTVVVQPRVPNNRVDPVNTFGMQDATRPYYAMHRVDDAKHLRDTLLVDAQASDSDKDDRCGATFNSDGAASRRATKPRIAILNRHHHREWLNTEAIVQRLLPYAANQSIPIVFFESNTTFLEQITFFRNVDILLSPHGAQLTGLPFMPDCGGVLEIFPAGYYLPFFFGSLALASNLQHGYVSITNTGDWRAESAEGMESQSARQKVRNKQLCPDTDSIFDSAMKLIQGWESCCEN